MTEPAATAVQTHLPSQWIRKVLTMIGGVLNHENNRFMTAWERSEGGDAQWNPLNSTLVLGGSVPWSQHTPYNSIGVQNYMYGTAGCAATALTLIQRGYDGKMLYGPLVSDLQNGTHTAEQIVERNDATIRLWGTNPDLILEVLKNVP